MLHLKRHRLTLVRQCCCYHNIDVIEVVTFAPYLDYLVTCSYSRSFRRRIRQNAAYHSRSLVYTNKINRHHYQNRRDNVKTNARCDNHHPCQHRLVTKRTRVLTRLVRPRVLLAQHLHVTRQGNKTYPILRLARLAPLTCRKT